MKALVKKERGEVDLELVEMPKPECPKDGVVLKVRACAICGSDIHYYHDTEPMPVPQIMGHEFCGDIEEVGENVEGWKVGDFVVSQVPAYPCGECEACKDGRPAECPNLTWAGLTGPGAYAQYIVSYPQNLITVPDNVSENMAACFEPSAIAVHAINRMPINPDDVVVVSGVGIIGLLTIQVLKIRGVKRIIALGIDSDEQARLPLALKYGAEKTINVQHGAASDLVLEYTGGQKVDLAIDCVGSEQSILEMFKMTRIRGTIGGIGVPPTDYEIPVNWYRLVWDSQNIVTTFSSDPEDWYEVLEYMKDGKLSFDDAITHELALEDWDKVFKDSHNPSYVKAVFKPNKL